MCPIPQLLQRLGAQGKLFNLACSPGSMTAMNGYTECGTSLLSAQCSNVDTDVIVSEEPPAGSTRKPDEVYGIIERFSQVRVFRVPPIPSSLPCAWKCLHVSALLC